EGNQRREGVLEGETAREYVHRTIQTWTTKMTTNRRMFQSSFNFVSASSSVFMCCCL
uniref:Uncharacterized protein n=1 Tax=Aegilops tauschii subsp. strangulata TaxID=200361 RepID=A0A453PDG1_AEGTS